MATVSAPLDPNEAYLELIANPENALLDIIAVHGMNTRNDLDHPNKTWTHQEPDIPEGSGTHWLRDLLPSKVPQARIMMYQYNANVAFGSSTAGVQEQAENLLQLISVKREDARSRPIIFIAHSLGGIIVKQALATAYNAPFGEHAAIYVFTFALFLFGVPHQGSGVARQQWASIARQIFQFCGNSTNASFLNSVTEGSNYAEQLQDSFKPLLNFYNVFTVCETKREGVFGIIVPKESATLGASSEDVYSPNRSHRTICKFRDSDDPVWQHVSDMLRRAADRAVSSTHYSSVSDTRKAMVYRLSTNLEGAMVVSQQTTQPIAEVNEQAQNITEELQAGHPSIKDLDQVVRAQTANISGYAQSWGVIILAVLSYIPGLWFLGVAAIAVSTIARLPKPVDVIQEAERVLERQKKIVDLTKQAIEALGSECHSALQTQNTLQTFLNPGISFSTIPAVNQLERVRPLQLALDKEIAGTVQKIHRLIHLDQPESERRLELLSETAEKVKSLGNADPATFWLEISPYAKEKVEADRQYLLENRATGAQEEDDAGCLCVIL